jgi:uncharacterized paraquat-inducible protein A
MDIAGTALRLLIISAKVAFISISVFAFIAVMTLLLSAIFIAINYSVLGDIHSLIQMWLPFNLGVIVLWIFTASASYLTYRLSLVAISYINAWLNR